MRKGKLLNDFLGKNITFRQFFFPSVGLFLIVIIGMVIIYGLIGHEEPDWEGAIILSIMMLILMLISIGQYRTDTAKVARIYQFGIETPRLGFYPWESVIKVEQEPMNYRGPLVHHLPCFKLTYEDGKESYFFQSMDRYTELYHCLYKFKVANSSKSLYLFEIDSLGALASLGSYYTSIYYSKSNKKVIKKGEVPFWLK